MGLNYVRKTLWDGMGETLKGPSSALLAVFGSNSIEQLSACAAENRKERKTHVADVPNPRQTPMGDWCSLALQVKVAVLGADY